MRFRGKDYTGKGVTVAIIDTGIDVNDPRMEGAEIEGWSIALGATGHALLSSDYKDEHGHGTEIAAAIRYHAPDAKLVAIKIMAKSLRTSAELMAAGIETASRNGAHVVNVSFGTPNQGKALMLNDCCANAVGAGSLVLAAAHPAGKRVYPAELPESVAVGADKRVSIDKFFYHDPKHYPRKQWGIVSGRIVAHGMTQASESMPSVYQSTSIATAYMSGVAACLAEALAVKDPARLTKLLHRQAIIPNPEIGYS